ncbi:hypothetical protein GCM10010449_06330 [Streptomyces rectiviolaceus]|uniref:Uncharacterized protein n=1 Tax=Streptomyces rectiviolaceus TaxID=332591 RepID=A0ABP6M929_9ACTN
MALPLWRTYPHRGRRALAGESGNAGAWGATLPALIQEITHRARTECGRRWVQRREEEETCRWPAARTIPTCRPIRPTKRACLSDECRRHHREGHRAAPAARLAGAALTETFQTPALLAELGLNYVLDWTNDDRPCRLNVPGTLTCRTP